MFPTTVWSTIRHAAANDPAAMSRFAERYRPAIRAFIRGRGYRDGDADDICHEVFLRLLTSRVLTGAHPDKGRFRSLMSVVARRVIADFARRSARGRAVSLPEDGVGTALGESGMETPALDRCGVRGGIDRATQASDGVVEGADAGDDAFDRNWILHLSGVALEAMAAEGSPYYAVLRDHLAGVKQDRNRLWIARRKLIALIRHEVAMTCDSHAEFEDELAYLSRFLRPATKSGKKE